MKMICKTRWFVAVLIGATAVLAEETVYAAEPERGILISGEPGAYTVERWKRDWPGCRYEDGVEEGRLEVVRRGEENSLRITCAPGKVGPAEGGCGWRWPVGRGETMTVSYRLRFDPDFEFVKGGKLPGLSGGPESVTGGKRPDGTNGFSARLMWRRDGRGEAYVYHMNQPSKYGESFRFPEAFRFPRGETVEVRLRVEMNRPGERNGTLRVWVKKQNSAEELVVNRSDLAWRSVESFAADSVQFEVFHGGDDASWSPTRACGLEIGGLRVGRD